MNKRGTGAVFCLISAILYSTRYISAAIFGSGISTWNERLFNAMLKYVGNSLKVFSILALIIGLVYLIWGEYEELNKNQEG
ncbi:hypothetical protein [Thermohalobacter berrensis]|uniref:Uncharacterized protein n=1 Tax=Thermohalobacter berrensis TaxID=99594 RepID=A0A419SXX2_9FIRM|nr:hypothetical protein [Thermohalobacter berrensis]RKD30009.1 hypothetical protein BET03_04710 [Thermohalobacter berrensis]